MTHASANRFVRVKGRGHIGVHEGGRCPRCITKKNCIVRNFEAAVHQQVSTQTERLRMTHCTKRKRPKIGKTRSKRKNRIRTKFDRRESVLGGVDHMGREQIIDENRQPPSESPASHWRAQSCVVKLYGSEGRVGRNAIRVPGAGPTTSYECGVM